MPTRRAAPPSYTRLLRSLTWGVAILLPILVILAAEIGLRWYRNRNLDSQFWKTSALIHKKSADPGLIYELVPGSEAIREGVRIKINPSGFRDDGPPGLEPGSAGRNARERAQL